MSVVRMDDDKPVMLVMALGMAAQLLCPESRLWSWCFQSVLWGLNQTYQMAGTCNLTQKECLGLFNIVIILATEGKKETSRHQTRGKSAHSQVGIVVFYTLLSPFQTSTDL